MAMAGAAHDTHNSAALTLEGPSQPTPLEAIAKILESALVLLS